MNGSVRKVIIPVAGYGTRFLPATKAMPKEMLPIIDKPVIQYIVEEAVASGITDIILVTSGTKRAVEDHFDDNHDLERWLRQQKKERALEEIRRISQMANFIYVRQKGPYGNAIPVLNSRHLIGNEPFAVVFGDDVFTGRVPRLRQMLDVFERYGDPVLGVVRVPRKETHRYGIIDPAAQLEKRVYQVKNVVEKPEPKDAPSVLAVNAGFVLLPEIFSEIERLRPGRGKEFVLLNAVKPMLKKHAVNACEIDGVYYDNGSKIGWLHANIAMALARPDLAKDVRNMLKSFGR